MGAWVFAVVGALAAVVAADTSLTLSVGEDSDFSFLARMGSGGAVDSAMSVTATTSASTTSPADVSGLGAHGDNGCAGIWGPWSACTQTCGGGTTSRSRDGCSGALQNMESKACNEHACSFAPECDQAHVHCKIATVQQSGTTVRVPRMTHSRKFMHIDAQYTCKVADDSNTCTCTCNKQPPCCTAKNLVLKNQELHGNRYSNIASTHDCCDLCYAHPKCSSWQLSGSICVLKTGTPSYEKNPSFPTVTHVGTPSRRSIRPSQSSCDPPFFVERDPSLAGIHPGPGSVGGQSSTGPHQLHPFAGVPHEKIEVANHQMLGTAVNGLPGQAWVEAQDKAVTGSALEWQRGHIDVRDQPQGQD